MVTRFNFRKNAWSLVVIFCLLMTACQSKATSTLVNEAASPAAPTQESAEVTSTSTQTPEIPPGQETPVGESGGKINDTQPSSALSPELVFAAYKEPAVQAAPTIQQPEIAADLSNVYNPFALSQAQLDLLAKNGFVVSEGMDKEFYGLYERARYDNKPIFVTSDSMLHIYHLLFDKVLRTAERKYFIDLLKGLNAAMLAETDRQYQELKGTGWEEAAQRSVAFIGVASKLLDPTVEIPDYASELVEAELALIGKAEGMIPSPIFPGLEYGEDYTQYIPRGHYTLDENLKAYFKSMMWMGRMTFRLKANDPEIGKAESRMAILLVNALQKARLENSTGLEAWQALYAPTAFFVGRSDDLTVLQYAGVMETVYGKDLALASFTDEGKLDQFIAAAGKLPPPRILGIVINDTDNVEDATKGMRFMGQRFVPDAYIFRELMYRNVGTSDDRRGLPKGLDIPAAMGSERAYQILDQMGETHYANYVPQMDKMRNWLASLGVADWTETLYNTWLYTFYPLLDVPVAGYPAFMRSAAWLDKELNTVLGSWTELKHDTILYAKQAYAEMGGGPPPPPPLPPIGYVEPVPDFYARLGALTAMTRTGLGERGLLDEQDSQNLQRLEILVASLQTIAEKELQGEPLTQEEKDLIRYIGGEMEHLTMAAADSDAEDPNARVYMDEDPQAAVVADVATDPGDPNGPVVLEEGIGRINEIHAIVPVVQDNGQIALQIAKGGVFSYYEFPWPMSDRLTDEKWRQMLADDQAPPLPEWTSSFYTPQGEFSFLTVGINNFQNAVTTLYWEPVYGMEYTAPVVAEMLRDEIEGLNAAKQYIGHQLISAQVRSVDMQSDKKAVVTVRETWSDKLYTYTGSDPAYDVGDEVLNERGPYALDVTYTLEEKDGYWEVTNAVYANQPPEW